MVTLECVWCFRQLIVVRGANQELMLTLLLAWPTRAVLVRELTSCFCSRISSTIIGGCYICLSMNASAMSMLVTRCFLPISVMSEVFSVTTLAMAKTGSLSSGGLLSFSVVKCRDNASAD